MATSDLARPASRRFGVHSSGKSLTLALPTTILGLALTASVAAAQYRPTHSPLEHVAVKSLISAGVYATLREGAGLERLPAALLSTVGVLAAGKLLEAGRGHRLPWGDVLHDAGWHALIVLPLALRSWEIGLGIGGGLVVTRRLAVPRW